MKEKSELSGSQIIVLVIINVFDGCMRACGFINFLHHPTTRANYHVLQPVDIAIKDQEKGDMDRPR